MKVLDRSLPCSCAVHLSVPTPDPEVIGKRLLKAKCKASGKRGKDGGWALSARHPNWGEAQVEFLPAAPKLPPLDLIEYMPGLTKADPKRLATTKSVVRVLHAGTNGSVPEDRKAMLWFARTVMGDEGTVAYDIQSQLFWMPDAIDDELMHDAGLSVRQLYIIHAVTPSETDKSSGAWVHSHGLSSLGVPEFDIVAADRSFDPQFCDAVVAALLEGAVAGDEVPLAINHRPARLVDVAEFMRQAKPEFTSAREDDEDHAGNRVVVCDQIKKTLGFGGKPQPFTPLRDAESVQGVALPTEFSAMSADRARASLPFLRRAIDEFRDWKLDTIVKLKLETDSGSHEFPWFSVQGIADQGIDATLLNEPFDIASLHAGDRRRWPVRQLSSWMMPTPFGMLSPDSLHAARVLREHSPAEFGVI